MLSKDNWQDYRGKGEGVLIHLDTSKKHALPVREAVDAAGRHHTDPNYETGTFGFLSCVDARTRLTTMKNRRRYFLFGTRYQGFIEELRGKFLIIGYMRLDKVLEVRKRHVHRWMEQQGDLLEPECMDMDQCFAFYSEEMNFYSPEDSFELSEEIMKSWGYKGKITKQMKLTFTEEKLQFLLENFRSKTLRNQDYIAAVKELEKSHEETQAEDLKPAEDW